MIWSEAALVIANDTGRVRGLRDAIHVTLGCGLHYMESTAVSEIFEGTVVWQGQVDVFALVGHPRADKVFAWLAEAEGSSDVIYVVTVLELPPVVSVNTAVEIVLLGDYRCDSSDLVSRRLFIP